jgi:DNA-binding response OmpR family regulator
MRLLLVEDEKKVADFVARGCGRSSLTLDVAYDGAAGGKWFQEPATMVSFWISCCRA